MSFTPREYTNLPGVREVDKPRPPSQEELARWYWAVRVRPDVHRFRQKVLESIPTVKPVITARRAYRASTHGTVTEGESTLCGSVLHDPTVGFGWVTCRKCLKIIEEEYPDYVEPA